MDFFILAVVICAVLIGAFVLAPRLTVRLLNSIGFSAVGPVAGTLAARLQSWIGNVAAGSLFAIAQGAAMGARIPTRAKVICGIVAGILCLIFVPYAQVIVAYVRVIVAYARVIVAHARANVACAQVIFGITTGIASSIFVAFARVILGTITGIVGLVFAFFA